MRLFELAQMHHSSDTSLSPRLFGPSSKGRSVALSRAQIKKLRKVKLDGKIVRLQDKLELVAFRRQICRVVPKFASMRTNDL